MLFIAVAKMGGDSVTFGFDAVDSKEALQTARAEAMNIFGVKPGETFKPTVSIKPVVDKEG